MAGTLTISTLSDGTNSTSSTNCIQGSAKAWVNFNGTAATIRASYNVSSITRNGTGEYTVSFTNAFADANYSYALSIGHTSGTVVIKGTDSVPQTTTSLRTSVYSASWTNADSAYCYVACFR